MPLLTKKVEPRSFEDITAGLRATVGELADFQLHHHAESASKLSQAAALKAEAEAHDIEAARASSVAAKIDALLA